LISEKPILLKASGVSGVLAPLVTFPCILLAVASSSSFSWTDNALSDLGVQTGATAILFNSGLIIGGILGFMFSLGLFVHASGSAVEKASVSVFALATLALMAIGIFPENVRPNHYYASVAFFVLFPISMLLMLFAMRSTRDLRSGLFMLIVGAVAAMPWVLYFSTHFVRGVAISELVSAFAASVWTIVRGCRMFKQASRLAN